MRIVKILVVAAIAAAFVYAISSTVTNIDGPKKVSPFSTVEVCMSNKEKTGTRLPDDLCEEGQAGAYWAYVFEQEGDKANLPGIGEHLGGSIRVQFTLPIGVTIGRVPNVGAKFDGKIS